MSVAADRVLLGGMTVVVMTGHVQKALIVDGGWKRAEILQKNGIRQMTDHAKKKAEFPRKICIAT